MQQKTVTRLFIVAAGLVAAAGGGLWLGKSVGDEIWRNNPSWGQRP